MLGNRRGNAKNICLLKRVLSNIGIGNLTGNTYQRDRIGAGRCDSRDKIGCSRSRSRKDHTDLSRSTRITISGMNRPLFMPRENMREFHLIDRIIQRKHGAARISKNDVHAFLFRLSNTACAPFINNLKPPWSSMVYMFSVSIFILYTICIQSYNTMEQNLAIHSQSSRMSLSEKRNLFVGRFPAQ